MSRYLAEPIEHSDRITVWRNSEVSELVGDDALDAVLVRDPQSDEERRAATTALFVLIGAAPHTGWLEGAISLDAKGFVLTGPGTDGNRGMFGTRESVACAAAP